MAFALGRCSNGSQAFMPSLIEQTVDSYFHAVKLFLFTGTEYACSIELLRADHSVLDIWEVPNALSCEVKVQTAAWLQIFVLERMFSIEIAGFDTLK